MSVCTVIQQCGNKMSQPTNTQCSSIVYIQGVTGGTDQTSGGCSLC